MICICLASPSCCCTVVIPFIRYEPCNLVTCFVLVLPLLLMFKEGCLVSWVPVRLQPRLSDLWSATPWMLMQIVAVLLIWCCSFAASLALVLAGSAGHGSQSVMGGWHQANLSRRCGLLSGGKGGIEGGKEGAIEGGHSAASWQGQSWMYAAHQTKPCCHRCSSPRWLVDP
jgi:hypothetical protein